MDVSIREEGPEDAAAVQRVNAEAFGQPQEGHLVHLLRTNKGITLSLVAVVDDRVVGHILFSPVRLQRGGKELEGAGLGPMAVLPELQRKGIGSKLVNEGIRKLRRARCPFVVVLGHPDYYPRFGFVPASGHGIGCKWEVPDNAFMLLSLDPLRLKGASGLARYRDEFSTVA